MLNGYFGCCEFLFLFCVFFGGWFPLRTGKTGEEVFGGKAQRINVLLSFNSDGSLCC